MPISNTLKQNFLLTLKQLSQSAMEVINPAANGQELKTIKGRTAVLNNINSILNRIENIISQISKEISSSKTLEQIEEEKKAELDNMNLTHSEIEILKNYIKEYDLKKETNK